MKKNIVAVSAGLSQPSSTRLLTDRLADAAVRALEEGDATAVGGYVGAGPLEGTVEAEVHVIELRELAVDIANMLVTRFAGPALREALDAVEQADGVIAVTPIFTASYSGLFKSFFDLVDHEALRGVPVLIAATGGTARHSLALEHAMRPLFSYLGAQVSPTAVFAASEDWSSAGSNELSRRTDRAAAEFARLVTLFERPAEPELVPFEEQLRALGAN